MDATLLFAKLPSEGRGWGPIHEQAQRQGFGAGSRRSSSRARAGGQALSLGATWDGLGVNFALFSAHATRVELCLFDESGETEIERIELPEYTDEVWHGYLPT